MAAYKLRVPEQGTVLHGEDLAVVADSIDAARQVFSEYDDHEMEPMYLHSMIGRCQIVYAADIAAGDCHEDAAPGDTTVWYEPDTGRDLAEHECRVWRLGAPPLAHWQIKPLAPAPVKPSDVPAGTPVHHRRLGSGVIVGNAKIIGKRAFIDVQFNAWIDNRWQPAKTLACCTRTISIMATRNWPATRYALTVEDEHVADGSRETVELLLGLRLARLHAQWQAQNFDEDVAARAAMEVDYAS